MALRFWICGPFFLAVATAAIRSGTPTLPVAATWFTLGIGSWTMIEYLLHRFAFHGFAPHYLHHEDPANPTHILAPLQLSLSAAGALFLVLWVVTSSALDAAFALAGVLSGYLVYEGLHLRIHSTRRGGWLLRRLRKHHFHHHFADHTSCYGVTSPLWDFVFRSLPEAPFRTVMSPRPPLVKG